MNEITSFDDDNLLSILEKLSLDDYRQCAWLRKMIIAPAIKSQDLEKGAELLKRILLHHPHSIMDLKSLSSVLIRLNKRHEASIYLQQLLNIEKDNYGLAAQLIQLKYQDKKLEEAEKLAMKYAHAFSAHERLFQIGLIVLARTKQYEFCIHQFSCLNFGNFNLTIGILAAQIAHYGKNHALSDKIILQLQGSGHQDARLKLLLAKNLLEQGDDETKAIVLLTEALALDSKQVQVHALLGELLLKQGHTKRALIHLQQFQQMLPHNTHALLLNGRALKALGQYKDAANLMVSLAKMHPTSTKWKRYAASALIQGGKIEEAKTIFEEGVQIRNKQLPAEFSQAFHNLFEESVNIPPARFKWLWQIVDPKEEIKSEQRLAYEKQAKWVHLFDHLLIDWLECRPHQADEVMAYFDDLSEMHALISHSLSFKKGLILAGAHVGPLFAIPLALELLDLPHKWLASTPNISSLSYKKSLISTSEQSETQVVRQMIQTLNSQEILAFAIDGTMSPSAPVCPFENQKVTYSDFAAKMAFRNQAPSFFISSYWKNNTIHFQMNPMPEPFEEESLDLFCVRWRADYFMWLKKYLIQHPDNARLSGGFWRSCR